MSVFFSHLLLDAWSSGTCAYFQTFYFDQIKSAWGLRYSILIILLRLSIELRQGVSVDGCVHILLDEPGQQ